MEKWHWHEVSSLVELLCTLLHRSKKRSERFQRLIVTFLTIRPRCDPGVLTLYTYSPLTLILWHSLKVNQVSTSGHHL